MAFARVRWPEAPPALADVHGPSGREDGDTLACGLVVGPGVLSAWGTMPSGSGETTCGHDRVTTWRAITLLRLRSGRYAL